VEERINIELTRNRPTTDFLVMAREECFKCADVTALLDRVKLRADTPCPDLDNLTLIRLVLLSSLGSLI
jgi:hypothetical protein